MGKCAHCDWYLRQGWDMTGSSFWCVNPECPAYALVQITSADALDIDENSDELPDDD
jgi:hypothetical protein